MTKVKVNCKNCEKEFEMELGRYNYYIKKEWNYYCEMKCQGDAFSKEKDKRILVDCKNCGKEFKKRRGQVKKSKNHFCSRSCSATYNNKGKCRNKGNPKLEISCLNCNEKVKKGASKYCGNQCQRDIEWKERVNRMELDGFCGSSESVARKHAKRYLIEKMDISVRGAN